MAPQQPPGAQPTAQHHAVSPDQREVCLRLAVSQLGKSVGRERLAGTVH